MKENKFEIIGLPLQASPVQRNMVGAGAFADDAGAEAAAWWDTLLHVAKTALPIAAQVAGSL